MSYDVYWVKNRAEKIADFEHPTQRGTDASRMMLRRKPVIVGCVATARRHSLLSLPCLL